MFDLTGKKALVTGSTQGIGYAIAKTLAEHGATVFVHGGSSMEKCRQACSGISGATAVLADLSEKDCANRLYEQTGDVDILVLNASVQIRGEGLDITEADFDRQLHVNLLSTMWLMQKYTPFMKKKGEGRIVTIGSVNQSKQNPTLSVYAASKSALLNLVMNMARQLSSYGITVNNVAPGVIATPRNNDVLSDEETRKSIYKKIPMGFAGLAEDVAPIVLLLCAEEGRYITGADIPVDGGMHL